MSAAVEELAPARRISLRAAAGAAAVAVFFTSLDNYAYIAWSGPSPLRWVYLFLGCAAVVVVARREQPFALLSSPVGIWIAFYFLATCAWGIWLRSGVNFKQVLDDRLRSVGFLVAMAILFDDARTRRAGQLAIAAAVVLASAVNLAELFGLVRFADAGSEITQRVLGRSGGFYINANDAATAIVLGLAASATALAPRWRLPLLCVAAAGVLATFSRGAFVLLVALTCWLLWRHVVSVRAALALGAACAIAAASFGGVTRLLESAQVLNENTAARLRLRADDSGRGELARKAFEMFADAPLAGKGLGATTAWEVDASSHNTYLNLAGDQGIVGLLTFPALLVALVACGGIGVPVAIVLGLAGVFSHGMLDQRGALLVVALAAARGPAAVPDAADEPEGEP